MITRKQYMNKEATFKEYYGQFSSPSVVACVVSYIGVDRLLASTDEHLNDIPMHLWDNAPWFGMQRAIGEANLSTHCKKDRDSGKLFTSLSDKVCCLKVAAHKWIEENRNETSSD